MSDASVMARETITLAGIEIELHEGGDGPPLLFLHGASGFTPIRLTSGSWCSGAG